MSVVGPKTGFMVTDPNTGNKQDLGDRYVSEDYLIDVYPNIVPGRTTPGLWSWGVDYNTGVLGQGVSANKSSPTQVGSLTNWKLVSSGFGTESSVAIKTDGTLWSWGNNSYGQLGQGNTTKYSSPVQVGALTNWKFISNNIHTVAIKTDGTLWSWGANNYGNLGLNDISPRSSPVQIGALTNWKQVTTGQYTTTAVKTDGTLWAWGANYNGQLGFNDMTHRSSPVQIGALTNWKQVANGERHTAAVKTDGTLWLWGTNNYGQLGQGNTTGYSSPVQVGTLTNWKQVACGQYYTSAIKTDGTLWTWGYNGFGQLGYYAYTWWSSGTSNVFRQSASGKTFAQGDPDVQIYNANALSTNRVVVGANGALWAWGGSFIFDNYGQLGLGENTTNYSSPVQVGALTNWKLVASGKYHTGAVKTDGTLWIWGRNNLGQLGLGNTTNYSSPVQVGTLTNWKQIACGVYHTGAVKTDGTLWMFGLNAYGSGLLGLNDDTNYSSPMQVGTLTNWKLVACGVYHTVAVKTDGTLWSWGGGFLNAGQLGLGDTLNYYSPTQVGTLTNWKQVACGEFNTIAVKTDGTLWSWGNNQYGQLGLNDAVDRSSPVQVGTLTNWKQIACGTMHSAAIKTDGTLWTWGNNFGQLGLGNTTNYSSPIQVGTLTTWKQVFCGSETTSAYKSDGTLWSSGDNQYGQLSVYDVFPINTSSPVQVGTLTNWKQVACGDVHTASIKTDGTLWTWGRNDLGSTFGYGTLGLSDSADRSSPVQVGTLTNWKQVACGHWFTLAIKDGYL